ncbi:MAG: hypothetical protein CVU41_12150 [Chloroflexi bacterium HGW-Chloroflexi-3]|nr:MAG: hypothetical protein CVU41_12150 [Chloroflexi bacterium HGW-Chloroflexi-3]
MSILSGICTGLDPDFNVFENLVPYTGKLADAEGGDRWSIIWSEITRMFQLVLRLPTRADNLFTRMEQGRLEVRVPALSREMERMVLAGAFRQEGFSYLVHILAGGTHVFTCFLDLWILRSFRCFLGHIYLQSGRNFLTLKCIVSVFNCP